MRNIIVKVHPSKANLKKKDQLAWKIAEIASDKAKINKDAVEMAVSYTHLTLPTILLV